MLKTYGLSHINIPVQDLERSVSFYAQLFGMQEIRRFDDCVMLRTPGTHEVFTMTRSPEAAKLMAELEGFHFGFRLTGLVAIDKVLEDATQLGGTPKSHGGTAEKGRVYAAVSDPNGYEVEIFWESD